MIFVIAPKVRIIFAILLFVGILFALNMFYNIKMEKISLQVSIFFYYFAVRKN
jgi:hypothetical protein